MKELHPVSQPLRGCIALLSLLSSSLLYRYCLGNFSFCTHLSADQQLSSGGVSHSLSHPAPEQNAAFTGFSERQLVLRNQKSCNYSIPHSQLIGMPGTGGVCWSVKEGLQDVTAGPWGLVLATLLVRPLSTYFKFPNLNCTAHKRSVKQHNLLYIWGKWFHSLVWLLD